jgi:GT2 family glycosyltransferase
MVEHPVTFSLCHPTLRLPDGWRKACQAWFDLADNPEDCEYILCTEEPVAVDPSTVPWKGFKQVSNEGRKTAASAWNTAGFAATGQFLITVADDFFPCPHWDSEIRKLVPDMEKACVLAPRMSSEDGFLYFSLLTRAAYERYGGWFFYPEYWGMYADNDFTAWARSQDIVIDTALEFRHLHPTLGTAGWDETYLWQQDPAAYERGKKIFEWRVANNFAVRTEEVERCLEDPGRVKYAKTAPPHKTAIAICLPGESFSSAWVSNWTNLFVSLLIGGYDPAPLFGYASSPFVARSLLLQEVLTAPMFLDYLLWIDDDNIVLPADLERLLQDFQEHPEADMIAGWCWVEPSRGEKAITTSCGRLNPGYAVEPFTVEEIREAAKRNELMPAGYTGFPVVLMRHSLLAKIGQHPFTPFIAPEMRWGMTGEDVAFCARVTEAGGKLYVDPRVKVAHLKVREIPDPPEPVAAERAESGDGGHQVLAKIRRVFKPGHRANSEKKGVHV